MDADPATQHSGHCHCGKFAFNVEVDIKQPVTCNCSICSAKGFFIGYTSIHAFSFTKGQESEMTRYQFNRKIVDHYFCPVCGVQTHARSGDTVMINIRCLEGVDIDSLSSSCQCNGRAL